jgi:putative polymerase
MYLESSQYGYKSLNKYSRFVSVFSIALVFIALFHHFILCFINTNLFNISGSWLVLTELTLIGITFTLFVRDSSINYVLLLLIIITNALILALFQQAFDPKQIRNFIVPVLLIWLGTKYDNKISVDKLVLWAAVIVLIVGLFELFFSDIYQKFFNVLNFLISTGRLEESSTQYAETSFALNGTRYGGRNLLSFLGDHRVSSVFLETVTVSNFATVIVAWGLAKSNLKEGWLFIFLGTLIAVLADSRFGTTIIMLMLMLRYTIRKDWLKFIAYLMPFFIILVCLYIGKDFTVFRDDFETRIGSTGHHILNFKLSEFFGLYSIHYSALLDQGYARLLHYNGLIISIVLWVSFCALKFKKDTEIFKYFIAVIITTNLAISGDSIYSFKWVAFMWFLIGTQLSIQNSIKDNS